MDRRFFLKTIGAAGACAIGSTASRAKAVSDDGETWGILVDTTQCAGCRNCEVVCAEANGLPEPDLDNDDIFDTVRSPSDTQLSVVNRFETSKGEVFVKRQCMHCTTPACASACLTRAMYKTDEGPVIWRENKCMGCRFCMVSCPFDVPTFEYNSAVPRILKCSMCMERLKAGERPACVENCPAEALTFGKRKDLVREAWRRIHDDPASYHAQVYGEHEVGGTGWLYLSAVPFEEIGFRADLGNVAVPTLTKEFLYGVPVVLTLLPPFLLALSQATRRDDEQAQEAREESDDDARSMAHG